MTNDELHLVALAKLGDNTAFKELYTRNKERIFNLVFQYTRNRQDAEDLLQETFTRAFLAIDQFRSHERAAFSTWLYRIGINCSLNFIRKRKSHRNHIALNREIPEEPAASSRSNPEETTAFNEMLSELSAGLEHLSAKQRMIFVLKHSEGLKTKEIAQLMKCGEGSIKKQLNRAMSTLVKRLAPHPLREDKTHENLMS